jgi:hypothetical protein
MYSIFRCLTPSFSVLKGATRWGALGTCTRRFIGTRQITQEDVLPDIDVSLWSGGCAR